METFSSTYTNCCDRPDQWSELSFPPSSLLSFLPLFLSSPLLASPLPSTFLPPSLPIFSTHPHSLINRFIVSLFRFMIQFIVQKHQLDTGKQARALPALPYSAQNHVWNLSAMGGLDQLSWAQSRAFLMNCINTCFVVHLRNGKLAPRTCFLCGSEVWLWLPFASHHAPRPSGIRDEVCRGGIYRGDMVEGWPTAPPEFLLSSFRLLISRIRTYFHQVPLCHT